MILGSACREGWVTETARRQPSWGHFSKEVTIPTSGNLRDFLAAPPTFCSLLRSRTLAVPILWGERTYGLYDNYATKLYHPWNYTHKIQVAWTDIYRSLKTSVLSSTSLYIIDHIYSEMQIFHSSIFIFLGLWTSIINKCTLVRTAFGTPSRPIESESLRAKPSSLHLKKLSRWVLLHLS